MADTKGSELRRRREALGLALAAVAEATGIPAEYLQALEADELRRIPPGYAERYRRVAARHLDRLEEYGPAATEPSTWGSEPGTGPVPTPEGGDAPASVSRVHTRPLPEVEREPRRLPLSWVRGIAVLTTVAFVLVLFTQVRQMWMAASVPASGEPPVVVKVRLLRNARLRVEVDGREQAHRLFSGAEEATFVGRHEVAVDIPDIAVVDFWMDGRRIWPRGRRGRERTLRFFAATEGVEP